MDRYTVRGNIVDIVEQKIFRTTAMASTAAHDSRNIIAVGVDDGDIVRAVNLLIEQQGGISFVCGEEEQVLPLPVIPALKICDKGIFDGRAFSFTPLFAA